MLSPLSVLGSWSWCNRAFLSVCQMSTISEEEWKIALTEILEELDRSQYKKMMMLFLSGIPKHARTDKPSEEMPQVIIEHYGVETSVHEINKIMDQIPRRDQRVQDQLRPFVERLKKKQESERRGEFIL